jgi:hypothetical protein
MITELESMNIKSCILIRDTISAIAWRDWGKPQKPVRIAHLWARIWIQAPDTKQKCQLLNCDIGTMLRSHHETMGWPQINSATSNVVKLHVPY